MLKLGFADSPPQSPPPAPVDHHEGDPSVGEEVNATLAAILPWGFSVLLHAGIVLLAIFILWTTVLKVDEEEVIIPEIELGLTPTTPVTVEQMKKAKAKSQQKRTVQKKTMEKSSEIKSVKLSTAIIGRNMPSGGAKNPFGARIAISGGDVGFGGLKGNAKKIVFLIDASGSLIDTLPFVILELKRSVNKLSEQQAFSIIFFQGDEVIQVPPKGRLERATQDRKEFVMDWIDPANHNVEPGGKTNPLKAINQALKLRPQLIFLLSDNITGQGKYAVKQDYLLKEISRANRSRTKISTIQFLYPDPLASTKGRKGTLELIADETGGVYKFLDARELNIQ